MGFYEIPAKKPAAIGARLENTVRVSLRHGRDGHRLAVSLAADVAQRLGWVDGDRVALAFGRDDDDGSDAGRLRLKRVGADARGRDVPSLTLRNGKSGAGALLALTHRLPDHLRALDPAAGEASFEIAGGVLTVELPEALRERRSPKAKRTAA